MCFANLQRCSCRPLPCACPLLCIITAILRSILPGRQSQSVRKAYCRSQANSHPAPPGESDIQRLAERLSHLRLDMWEMVGDGNCQVRRTTAMK